MAYHHEELQKCSEAVCAYREQSMTISEAIEELKNKSGTQFDPEIVLVLI